MKKQNKKHLNSVLGNYLNGQKADEQEKKGQNKFASSQESSSQHKAHAKESGNSKEENKSHNAQNKSYMSNMGKHNKK